MIGLLNAAFLFGIAAVAAPIVIHLVHRRRARVIDFPTLRFLREADRKIARRRRIEELLLLFVRCAVIVLVALALARPLFRPTPTAGSGAAATAVIVVDDSMSMRTAAAGTTRFDAAREAARRVLSTLHAGDSAVLVLPNTGTVGPTSDLVAIRDALDKAKPSFGAAKVAFDGAAKLLSDAKTPARELFVIGDAQRGSWAEAKVAGDFETYVVPVASGAPPNATLAALDMLSPSARAGASVRVRATVVNRTEAPMERTVTFEVDGHAVQAPRIALAAREHGVVSAEIDLGGAGWHEVRARLDPDALAADDEARLVLDVRDRLSVLAVGDAGTGAAADSFYLARALDAGGGADVTACPADGAGRVRLADYALVVSFGLPSQPVVAYAEKGGGVLVLGGPGAEDHGAAGALTLAETDVRHPIFRRLAGGDPPLDFAAARFYRTVPLVPAPGDAVVARFSDGSPALVEHVQGAGRILRFASGLTPDWTSFPLKVGFVPFVHSVASHLAAGGARERLRVGAPVTFAYAADPPTAVKLAGVERRVVKGVAAFDPIGEPGFYAAQEIFAAGPREVRLSVDVDPGEGDLSPGDPAALAALFAHGKVVAPEAIGPALDEARHGIDLTTAFLLAALAVLLFETWFANRVAMGR